MNVVKLMGGLGNQFFQYAFGEMLRKNGSTVYFDNLWFMRKNSPVNRPYILDKYNTNIEFISFHKNNNTIKECSKDMSLLKHKNSNFYGYWQYLEYYIDSIDYLRSVFVKKHSPKIDMMDAVSIHVRGGDYIGKHRVLNEQYYIEAFNIAKEIGFEEVFYFTDDWDYLKSIFPQAKPIGVNDACYDLEIMKRCKINIMANSTFSWWASFLNKHPDKEVICPYEFVVRKQDSHNYNNLLHYPINWIKVKGDIYVN